MKAEDLKPGMYVDLEGDEYADPSNDNPHLKYEYALVLDTEQETPTCVRVDFAHDSVGFPNDHELVVFDPETIPCRT